MSRLTWILIGAGVVGAFITWLFRTRTGPPRNEDLGSLSDQWIAEHRAGIDESFFH